MNQPAGSVSRMNAALNIFNAFKSRQEAKDHVQWGLDSPNLARIVARVERMRLDEKREHGRTS